MDQQPMRALFKHSTLNFKQSYLTISLHQRQIPRTHIRLKVWKTMFWEKKNIPYSEKNHFHSSKLTFTPVIKLVGGITRPMECARLQSQPSLNRTTLRAGLNLWSHESWGSNACCCVTAAECQVQLTLVRLASVVGSKVKNRLCIKSNSWNDQLNKDTEGCLLHNSTISIPS